MKLLGQILTCTVITILFSTLTSAQSDIDLLRELMEEDRSSVDALVMYPEDVRESIFTVSQHPELLIRIDGLQRKVKEKYIDLISGFDQDDQEKFYEALRYPDLLNQLVEDGPHSKKEIEAMTKDLPEEAQKKASELGRKRYKELSSIYELNKSTKEAFQKIIATYDNDTKEAIKSLVELPETLSLLTENINLTILIGNVFASDPDWARSKADSLNLEIARQNAEELQDYQEQLEQNPEAYQDMLDAAEQYAKDNDIEEEYKQSSGSDPTVQVVHHYPYWYGYPHWYTTPYWAPVPWYYHTGFYYGPGGGAVYIGFPSSYYVGWHTHYYPHSYVHLHSHYHYHYHRHPYSRNSFNTAVNVNINNNRNVVVNNRISRDQANKMRNNGRKPSAIGNRKNNARANTQNRNVDRNRPNTQNRSTQNRDFDMRNTQKKPSTSSRSGTSSYDRHRAADTHRQNWNARSGTSRSYSRPSPSTSSRSGTRRRG